MYKCDVTILTSELKPMLMLTFYQNVPLITTENILSSGESFSQKPLPGLKSGQTVMESYPLQSIYSTRHNYLKSD